MSTENSDVILPSLREIPTEKVFRWENLSYGRKIAVGFVSLIKGMRITLGYFRNPKSIVTQQYPENRADLKLPERSRALLEMNHDENGLHKCTACHICEDNCPNASIHIVERENPKISKTELANFVWRLDTCTFCNLCVMVCPFACLKMSSDFESAVFDQRLLTFNLNKVAGASATVLYKQPDEQSRTTAIAPVGPYEGPVALGGPRLAGLPRDSQSSNSSANPEAVS